MKFISELRQDIVSGDWVVIATGRSKRPGDFSKHVPKKFDQPRATCPFEKVSSRVLALYTRTAEDKKNWWVAVIPNKYPAFGKGGFPLKHTRGPYRKIDGVGFHEIVITRDHKRPFARMDTGEIETVLRAAQDRYLALQNSKSVQYISIFQNHGPDSGASISHPHSQIIAIPVIPPDIARSLKGTAAYFHQYKTCVHCVLIQYERRSKSRIVYENANFIVVAPYASKTAFELRIFPKKHNPQFELIRVTDRNDAADALQHALAKLYKGLRNPSYNFFIHTAPAKRLGEFGHYHWHIEILPKTAIWAGFEMGTGIEISTIRPEDTAKFLRKIKV